MVHIIKMNWIKPIVLEKRIENNILKLKIDWSGGIGKKHIEYSEIQKYGNEFHYKDDSIKLKKSFNSIKKLLWEFEFPKDLENELKKLK
jgi:hypothetical protein